jgi:aminobenzoyl-glutamate transport protein
MSRAGDTVKTATSKSTTQKILDTVERIGNSVPHPVVIFLILIAVVMVISQILYMLGASVSYQVVNPETHKIETNCAEFPGL